MYSTSIFLYLSSYLIYVSAVQQCCKGENIIIRENSTCWDGSNVTALPCPSSTILGPAAESTTTIKVDTDDTLIATYTNYMGYFKIAPDSYCLTKNLENNAEVALACVEATRLVHQTIKATVLLSLKAICGLITVLFLLAVFVVYLFVPDLQDIEGKCILNFVSFLAGAHLVVIFLPVVGYLAPRSCNTTDFLYFTSVLCCYNWLSVLSFHLWRITVRPVFRPHIQWFLLYSCYGYGVPLILLTTALALYYSQDTSLQEIGEFQCWIDGSVVVWGYFYGPALFILLISTILQFSAANKIWIGIGNRDCSQPERHLRKKSLVYMHLLLIMTLRKVIDVISYVYMEEQLNYLWQVADCRNFLTGGIIFFILVVLRNKVLKALAKRGLFCIKFPEKWKKLRDEEIEARETDEATLTRNSTSL